jgi:uncharacterized protein YkwD
LAQGRPVDAEPREEKMRLVASVTLVLGLAGILAAPAAAGPRHDAMERAIVDAVNAERADNGLSGLQTSKGLARAADYHSWEMLDADYFDHASRDGGPFDERVRRFADHRALGETLAWASSCDAERVVRIWMDSPPHRDILLSGDYRRIGVGKRVGDLGSDRACVVTADFGSKH